MYWVPAQYIPAIREVLALYGGAGGTIDAALMSALGFAKQ